MTCHAVHCKFPFAWRVVIQEPDARNDIAALLCGLHAQAVFREQKTKIGTACRFDRVTGNGTALFQIEAH